MVPPSSSPSSAARRLAELPRARIGRTARRVTFAILVTTLIPAIATIAIARTIIGRVSSTAFQPEFGAQLDQSLSVYADLARAIKGGMRAETEAIAANEALRQAAVKKDVSAVERELGNALAERGSLASVAVESCNGESVAIRGREKAVDRSKERVFTVRRPLGGGPRDACDDEKTALLVATFATPSARFDELEAAQSFTQAYHQIERSNREEYLDKTYIKVFLVLLFATVVLAAVAGVLVARPVTTRIAKLASATGPVAAGDLSIRVSLGGNDEVTDLGSAFNHMLEELERSRARVEFLKRIGEWQKMARRLAHEIKNPLTPIQLAVEECHRRYKGDDPEYKRILETTFEVVEEEVGSLRRLVSEFSNFARLPRAELLPGDLGEFLREQEERFALPEDALQSMADDAGLYGNIKLSFDVPEGPMPASFDREMLHRVLRNIVRNAAQALRDAHGNAQGSWGRVVVGMEMRGDDYEIVIDDDGPGIRDDVKEAIFDPYVTTKNDGTGLGLSIVKKIVVDHGGSIEAKDGPLGGARFRIRLPRAETPAAKAAAWESRGRRNDALEPPPSVP